MGVPRRNRPGELLGLIGGDAESVRWDLESEAVDAPAGVDVKGPYVQGRPNARFVYLSWGTVSAPLTGTVAIFRRAKLWLDGVAPDVMVAHTVGDLVARLGPLPPRRMPGCPVRVGVTAAIEWSAG